MKQLLTIIFSLSALAALAQPRTYTLRELFDLADQNSRDIRISQDALRVAQESAAARAQRLPDIDAQVSVGYNGDGVITDRNHSNAMSVEIPDFANDFSLRVSQVIYAGGAISNSVKIGKLGEQIAETDVERNRQQVRFRITGLYLDMMKTLNTMAVVEQNIALTGQLLDNMRVRVEQGTSLKNDVTRYELQMEEMKLQLRRLGDGRTIINDNLCRMLSLPEGTDIRPDEGILAESFAVADEQWWQEQTLSENSGIRQASLAVEMAERSVRLARSARLPRLAVVAEEHFGGPITIEIPPLNKNLNYWFVGIGLQYNFGSLYKSRNDVRRARYAQAQAQERLALAQEQIGTGVKSAYTNLQTAYAELQTCQKQVQLAVENYDVIRNRYDNGLALITDMLDASTMRLAAEIALEQARINIVYCHKQLEYLTDTL